jgi:hypothetical protein
VVERNRPAAGGAAGTDGGFRTAAARLFAVRKATETEEGGNAEFENAAVCPPSPGCLALGKKVIKNEAIQPPLSPTLSVFANLPLRSRSHRHSPRARVRG